MGRQRRESDDFQLLDQPPLKAKFRKQRIDAMPAIKPLTENQALMLQALRSEPQLIAIGPAGTGKSFLSSTHAADQFRLQKTRKIIIARPNVPSGRSIGYLKGTMEEKIGPWAVPIVAPMRERMGAGAFDIALAREDIEIIPFEYMRGRSWEGATILLDEAQNTMPEEMKMFLTRVGEDCQVIIDGDLKQCDLPPGQKSGLQVAIDLIDRRDLPVPIIEFTVDDIVRSGICAMWVRAFDSIAA